MTVLRDRGIMSTELSRLSELAWEDRARPASADHPPVGWFEECCLRNPLR